MGNKVDYQHGSTADGKTFKSTPAVPSTQFGTQDMAERGDGSQRPAVPGAKQTPPVDFGPGN